MGSSPRSYLFTSATRRIGVHTAQKYGIKPIRYVTLHFEISAAQIRSVTETAPPQPFFSVNRSPSRYGFRSGAKALRYRGNITLRTSAWEAVNCKLKYYHELNKKDLSTEMDKPKCALRQRPELILRESEKKYQVIARAITFQISREFI